MIFLINGGGFVFNIAVSFLISSSIETVSLYLIGKIPLFIIFAAAIAPIFVK